jgi:cytochrome c-type biogenesis protein
METTQNYSIFFSFIAGILSFFSPCILPLIPAYLSYITGMSVENLKEGNTARNFFLVLFFVAGFTFIFTVLGASATWLGKYLLAKQTLLRIGGGIIIIILGIHLTGLFKITRLYREKRLRIGKTGKGYFSAFLIGMAFAAGWTPCVGPVLASILIVASSRETVIQGVLLLVFYSLGIGIPFIITTIAITKMLSAFSRIKRYYHIIEVITGILLIVIGLLLILNRFHFLF